MTVGQGAGAGGGGVQAKQLLTCSHMQQSSRIQTSDGI